MAVEMAKLSLWLITLAKDRPFSFVDHALRTGDSLLGITDLAQLRVAHLDPALAPAVQLRPRLRRDRGRCRPCARAPQRARGVRCPRHPGRGTQGGDAREADAALDDARLLGDLVVGAALAQLDDADPLATTESRANVRAMLDRDRDERGTDGGPDAARALADEWLVERRRAVGGWPAVEWADRDPFHWALEFPEVWRAGWVRRGRG